MRSKLIGLQEEFGHDDVEVTVSTHDPVFDAWRLNGEAGVALSYLTMTPNHFRSQMVNRAVYTSAAILERAFPDVIHGSRVDMLREMRQADAIIPSGGDVFTSDYGNLRKHVSQLLASPRQRAFMMGQSIGPFGGDDERYFLKASGRLMGITARESETFGYLRSLNLGVPVWQTADVAFLLPSLDRDVAESYLRTRFGVDASVPMVALSVSQGLIKYSGLDRDQYYRTLAGFVDALNERGRSVLLIPHVMERSLDKNDFIACENVYGRLSRPELNRIISGEPSASDFKGIIGLCECLVGARTHATIASISQQIPTVSIAYSRKAHGIMRDVFGDRSMDLTIHASGLGRDSLMQCYEAALENPPHESVVLEMKRLARLNFSLLRERLVSA